MEVVKGHFLDYRLLKSNQISVHVQNGAPRWGKPRWTTSSQGPGTPEPVNHPWCQEPD